MVYFLLMIIHHMEIVDRNGWQLQVGDRNPIESDTLGILRDTGSLGRCDISVSPPPISPQEEADGLSRDGAMRSSGEFERNRKRTEDGLVAIAEYPIERFGIKTESGVDIGSGMTGAMVRTFIRGKLAHIGDFVQLEVNHQSVTRNRSDNPGARVREGSYHELSKIFGEESQDTVTGLSSLDPTLFLENVIGEIRKTLKPGGYLFHMQDVRPGMAPVVQQMQHEGYGPGFSVEELGGCSCNGYPQLSYRTREGYVSVGELFRRRLGRAIESDPGMELVFNDWITARKRIKDGAMAARLYFMNVFLLLNPQFVTKDQVAAVITVARKK